MRQRQLVDDDGPSQRAPMRQRQLVDDDGPSQRAPLRQRQIVDDNRPPQRVPMRQRQLVDDDGTPQRAPMRHRQMVNNQGNRGIEDPDDIDEAARRCFPNHREYRLHAASLVHSQEARSTDMCVLTLLSAASERAFQA